MEGQYNSLVYMLITFNGILVGLVAFFLKQLLSRFSKIEDSLNSLNVKIAEIITHQDHHKDRFHTIENNVERLEKETKSVRERLHLMGNDIHGLALLKERFDEIRNRS